MAFKELLILIAIAVEDIDVYPTVDASHRPVRTQLPVGKFEIRLILAITSYPNVIVIT